MNRRVLWAVTAVSALAWLWTAIAVAAKDVPLLPISIRLNPRIVVSAPLQKLEVFITIPRDKDNRAFCLVVEGSEGYYSSTCQSLAGDTEPVLFARGLVDLRDEGEYHVLAELYRVKPGMSRPYAVAVDKVLVGGQTASIGN